MSLRKAVHLEIASRWMTYVKMESSIAWLPKSFSFKHSKVAREAYDQIMVMFMFVYISFDMLCQHLHDAVKPTD